MGERFALKLEFETGESLYHLPVTENEVVARWPYEAELRVNGRLLDTQLLFQPVYEEGEQVVAGDTVSLWREVERIGKELLEGRPDWVKGILLIAPMISLGLVGWFLYLAWEKVAGDLPEAEQQQMLRWLIIMGVVGGIVF
jgi:hypothetical protein